VALLAVLFLDERLAWAHWAALGLVVIGAAAVSYRGGAGGSWFRPAYGLLLLGALMIGVAQVILKSVADDLSVWHSMALRGTGLFTSLALPYARPHNIVALARAMAAPRTAGALLITETIAPLFGNLLLLTALANGPVSLVSAVLGTRPVFVFLGTLAAGVFVKGLLEDRLTRSDIFLKGASALAVVAGVFLIALA
jgi:drug/metabolite transporter (DMT)-like permease